MRRLVRTAACRGLSFNRAAPRCAACAVSGASQARQRSSVSYEEDDEGSAFGGVKSVGVGIIVLGAGIVAINVNERRAAKQDILNDFCEETVLSLDEFGDKKPYGPHDIDGKLLHAHGEVKAVQPFPIDHALGATAEGRLRLRRRVEMFQWVETKHETKEKDDKGNEYTRVEYTYSQEWKDSSESTSDHRNPAFPSFSADVAPAGAIEMKAPGGVALRFSQSFIERLTDWEKSKVTVTDNGKAARSYQLEPLGDPKYPRGFYSRGKSEAKPSIGDIRVLYDVVPEGARTVLGKYTQKGGVAPFSAKLNESLTSQAPLVVPEEAHSVVEKASMGEVKSLVIPEWVAEAVESTLLAAVPLEYAYLERGHVKRDAAFRHYRRDQDNNTKVVNMVGSLAIVLGTFLCASPASMAVGNGAVLATSAVTGGGIAYATQRGAEEQAAQLPQRAMLKAKAGGSHDVEF